MAQVRKTKAVGYKRAEFYDKNETLKQLVDKALKKRSTVGKRKRNVSKHDDHPEWEVIGETAIDLDGFTFGTLMIYTPGTHPLFLVDDDSAESITLEKYKTPTTKDGKRRELLDSVLFFGVIDNHLIVMQSQALRAPHLEDHLGWLIRESRVTSEANSFKLVDAPPKTIRDRFTKNPKVRSITLGTSLVSADDNTDAEPTGSTKTIRRDVALQASTNSAGPLKLLTSLLAPTDIAKLPLEDADAANIELTLTVRYKSKTTKKGQALMDKLGETFRNTDDVDLDIELVGGGTIKGSQLKLSGTVRVTTYDGQPYSGEVYKVMREWFQERIKKQDVQV